MDEYGLPESAAKAEPSKKLDDAKVFVNLRHDDTVSQTFARWIPSVHWWIPDCPWWRPSNTLVILKDVRSGNDFCMMRTKVCVFSRCV